MKKLFAIASIVMMLMVTGCTCSAPTTETVEEEVVETVDTVLAEPADTLVVE